MAAGAEITAVESSAKASETDVEIPNANGVKETKDHSDSKSEMQMRHIVDMLSSLKLNPLAKEFFPASHANDDRNRNHDHFVANYFLQPNNELGFDGFPNNRRRRNNFSQGRKRLNGRAFRAQREDSIRCTVYVSDIDHNVTEERLAALFSGYGQATYERLIQKVQQQLPKLGKIKDLATVLTRNEKNNIGADNSVTLLT